MDMPMKSIKYVGQLSKHASKAVKYKESAGMFIKEHLTSNADNLHDLVRQKMKRMLESKPNHKSKASKYEEWKCMVFMRYDGDEEKPAKRKQGRPSAVLGDDPCRKLCRSMMKEMVDALEEFATKHHLSKEDALQMTVDECNHVWRSTSNKAKCSIPVDEACALLYNANLSSNQYQMLRTVCLKYDVTFPTRNAIDQLKNTFHPEITSYQLKSSVDIKSLLCKTASSLIGLNVAPENEKVDEYKLVWCRWVWIS